VKFATQLLLTFLLNASWQVALIVGFGALCDWLLRGTSPRFRHVLWISVLLLSVGLPSLSCWRLIKPPLIAKQPTAELISEPIVVSTIVSTGVEALETSQPETRLQAEPARRNFWMSPVRVNQKLAATLAVLYVLLLIYRGAKLFRAWRRTQTIVSSAYEFQFLDPVRTVIQECQAFIGVSRVRILCSAVVPVPITVGVLKPLIILPDRLLHEGDRELLVSAIGHELVHVARRDYLANLIYEFMYVPLSFHPAAALVRRRIKQTRELCCDQSVASKLLRPEVYARSLVRLIGSVPLNRRLAADTTIGITESDNLEVRIMSLLRTPKFTPRRKTLLLITALLLLVVPCVAGASFALTLDIVRQEPRATSSQQSTPTVERQSQERAVAELKRQARVLKEQMRVTPEAQRAQIEAEVRELQRNLELHNRTLQEYQQNRNPDERKRIQARLEDLLTKYPSFEPQLREQLAELQRQGSDLSKRTAELQKSDTDRKAKLIYKVEPKYPEDARAKKIEGSVLLGLTIDHGGLPQNIQIKRSLDPSLDQAAVEALRQWRFEPAIKDGQPVSMWITVEVYFRLDYKQVDQEQKERAKIQDRELEERAKAQDREKEEKLKQAESYGKGEGQGKGEGSGQVVLETRRRKDAPDQGREERARKQVEMTRGATISMDRAIQIATSQIPGKVLACSLGRDGDKIFYHLVIINTEGDKSTTTYVWLSATDGQIIKTEKEREPREQEW
jgi:TonB family protein